MRQSGVQREIGRNLSGGCVLSRVRHARHSAPGYAGTGQPCERKDQLSFYGMGIDFECDADMARHTALHTCEGGRRRGEGDSSWMRFDKSNQNQGPKQQAPSSKHLQLLHNKTSDGNGLFWATGAWPLWRSASRHIQGFELHSQAVGWYGVRLYSVLPGCLPGKGFGILILPYYSKYKYNRILLYPSYC